VITFEKILRDHPGSEAYEPAFYLLAFSHYKINNFDKAAYVGENFIKEFPHSTYLVKILGVLGESKSRLVENYMAAYYFIKFCKATDNAEEQRSAYEKTMKVLPELSSSELEKLHRTFMADAIDEQILYNLIRVEIAEGKEKEAKRDFGVLLKRFPSSEYAQEFEDFKRFASLGEKTGIAGVLLPLTGKFASYGARLMEIIKFFEKNRSLPFTLYPVDTRSDPVEAVLAASRLVDEKRVDFMIGPIFSIEAFSVCGYAHAKGIPVIIPAALEARFDLIPMVFTPEQNNELQAKVLARYCVRQLDMSRFAVLYPDMAKYKAAVKAFMDEVLRNNAEIVAAETFDPDSITLKWELERIKAKDPDAIFLAMDTDMIINTAPQVLYYRLEGVKLIGIESFDHERVPRFGEKYVESAVFVTPAAIDTTTMLEARKHQLDVNDFISARFFQTLWDLKGLAHYDRASLPDHLNDIFEGSRVFNVYTIRNGEFVKLTEVQGE
jgi:ABC-type branched-subunit amino acid transport system substrate-binding protein